MFTKAGYSPRYRVICTAIIGRWGWRGGPRMSQLVRFVRSGEYAWLGAGGATWPENVSTIFCFRDVVPAALYRMQLERSDLPR